MDIPISIPEHLRSTYILLKQAFPEGIPEQDYLSLMAIMQETGMSDRSVALALLYYFNDSYDKALYSKYFYQVSHVLPNTKIATSRKELVRTKLKLFGFDEWKDED